MFDVSIIIPSYNTRKLLDNCISSIIKETKIKYEIIVVDNGSTDGSQRMVAVKYPKIKIINKQKNIGFAGAVNLGFKIAQSDRILLLNSDTIINDRAIDKTIAYQNSNQEADIVGCQLLNQDKTIQPSGGFLPNLGQIFGWMLLADELPIIKDFIRPYQQSNRIFYKTTQPLGWMTGAFMLIKRNVWDVIGLFDEHFFMYGEEVEWCWRANKANFKVWYFSGANIVHLKSKSSSKGLETAILGEFQGIKKLYAKQMPALLMLLRLFLKIGAMLRVMIFGILLNNREKRLIYEKAYKLA